MIIENKIYNPAAQPKQWLIEHFVVRTKVFEKIFKDIQSGKMKYPEQHYLIQGQRGMGKTTLLLRLKYEIENTTSLNSWLVPVFFNEESYDITTLSNLWEKLLKYLDDLWQTGGMYYNKTDEFVGKPDYEEKCFDYLLQVLKEKKKKLIIFFDNFGQLFLDNLKDKEQRRLREILMNCPDLRFIGASAIVLKDLHDYSKPFFEFFKIINLEGLSKTETFDLIKKLTEKSGTDIDLEKNKPKIETLAILTGGVIRTIMLVYEAILVDQDGTALRDLEMILDRITPLYKHRIEDLPVQQRRIVDVIAKNWDAISAKDIAGNIREDGQHLATKIISAQLQQLEKNNVIEKKQTTTKNNLYQLKERFFNIWYLMRLGDRKDKCRVIWLTKFLEMWYEDRAALKSFIKEHIKHLRSGKYHAGSAILITEALSNSSKLNIDSFELLLKETSNILDSEQKKVINKIRKQKLEQIFGFYKEGKFKEVIEILKNEKTEDSWIKYILACSYLKIDEKDLAFKTINKIEPNNEGNNYLIGLYYYAQKDFGKVIEHLEKSINKYPYYANNLIGRSHFRLKNFRNAVPYFEKALIHNNSEDVYESLIDALLLIEDKIQAEKYCVEAIKKGFVKFNKELADMYLTYYDDKIHYNKAKTIIDTGLKTDPDDADYNHLKGAYEYFVKNVNRSLKYLKKAHNSFIENGGSNYFFIFNIDMIFSVLVDIKHDKSASIDFINSMETLTNNEDLYLYRSFVRAWENRYQESTNLLSIYFDKFFEKNDANSRLINDIILLLLSRGQFHSVVKIFEKEELRQRYKPVYYALMHYLKDEYPNEIIKMGEELRQPVKDIMKRIEEMAIEYK